LTRKGWTALVPARAHHFHSFALGIVLLFVALASRMNAAEPAINAGSAPVKSAARAARATAMAMLPQAAQPGPKIWLGERKPLGANYVGAPQAASAQAGVARPGQSFGSTQPAPEQVLASGQAAPLAMVSGDFDHDGFSDLAVGYSAPGGGGIVAIHRGNIDAFAPQSQESWLAIGRGDFPAPFLPDVKVFSVPVSPDFLAVGKFTSANGFDDLLVAARGGSVLYVFPGNGDGTFGDPQALSLTGGVTSLTAGDLGHARAFGNVIVGLSAGSTSALQVLRGSKDGLVSVTVFRLDGPASNILFGYFGGQGQDVAFLSSGKIKILRSSPMELATVSLQVSVRAFALGSFLYDRNAGLQIAALSSDGSINFIVRSEFDPRVYTAEEFGAIRRAKINHQPVPSFVPAPSFPVNGWKIAESVPAVGSVASGQTPVFFRARISSNGADDVMWLNSSGRMALVSRPDSHPGDQTFAPAQVSIRPYSGTPIAALPARINADGRPGVLTLHQGETGPSALMPLPDPTFFPNRFDDIAPRGTGVTCLNTTAVDGSNDCTLREAIIKANVTPGTDSIMLQAGTYTLAQPRAASPNYDAHTGTLNINDSLNITGAGQNSTIITWGTPLTGTVDLAVSVNEDIGTFTTATASISNLTIQNAVNHGMHSNDGDGGCMEFDTGTNGTATLSLTSVTLQNCSTLQGGGAGLVIFNFVHPAGLGSATISNSIIQNNSATDNPSAGAGGGIAISNDAFMTMTNSQVLNNKAVQVISGQHGIGGGIVIFSPQNVTGASAQTQIHASTISGNKSAGFGGGIHNLADFLIDQGSVISNNTAGTDGTNPVAGQEGGGLYLNTFTTGNCPTSLSGTCTSTLSKVTITGNTATGNGGGISNGSGSASGSMTMSFSRLAGNTAAAGSNLNNNHATATVTNNWWGTNAAASTINSITATTTFDPFIVLTHQANPAKIRINQSTTLTGDMSKDNHGSGAALTGNLNQIVGLPITFNAAVLGSIPQAQPETLNVSAQATATFNAGNTGGLGSANATVDQAVVPANSNLVASATESGTTATITTVGAHGFVSGQQVTISGVGISGYNGTFLIGTAPTSTTFTYTTTGGLGSSSGGTASIGIVVLQPPSITKSFSPTTIKVGGTSTITFSITNGNVVAIDSSFTDDLTSGATVTDLVVAASPNIVNGCGGTVTAVAGASSISFANAALPKGNTPCTITVDVTGTTDGVKPNSVTIDSADAGNGNTATASPSLKVINPPTILKTFGGSSIPFGATTSLTFTVTNPNSNAASVLNGIAFTDTLPTGGGGGTIVVATPNGLTNTCSTTPTATAGSGIVSLTGASLAAGASCTISLNVQGTAVGAANNSVTVSDTLAGTGNTSTALLTVVKADTTTTVTSSVNPSVFGQSVTFTATVSPVAPGAGTPTGTVTFLDGGSPIGTGTLSGGVATFTTSALAVGNHTITTNYGGDGNFNGSTGSLTGNPQVVNKANTATTVTSSVNPSVFGQSVTFTATVSPVAPGAGTPVGTVTFLDGGSPVGSGTLSGGIATFTTSALAVGNHTITTNYGGDGNFNGSTGSLTGNPQVVNKADTATTVTSSANPSVAGQSVTFTATVSPVAPGSGTPVGTVTFLDGGSPIGTGTLSGGIATFTTSALSIGNHTITTNYGGDGNFNGSTGSLTGNPQVVNKSDTSTTVTSSVNPSVFGQSVTFTATVSPVAPGAGTPTGTVTFLDGGSPIGTGTLSGGIATFTTSALSAGNHTITTSYGGDGNFNGSTGSLTGNPQVVNKANTTTAVTSSANPSVFGQSVTFTATVSPVAPGAGTPTGTVTFLDGGSPIGTGTLSGGIATFTTSALAVGNHTITTSYGGDGNFNGSTGSLTGNPQVVNKANTTTAVTSSVNPSVLGQSVTFTATISPVAPGAGTPTGTVTFLDGGSPIGTGTLSGGIATFTTSALAVGNHTITTSYGGDGNFNGSTGSLTGNPQVVNKANSATTVTSSQNPSLLGQSVTFTATVSPVAPGAGTPTGTVTFLDGGSPIGTGTLSGGVATFTTSALALGNHTITTSYGGDGNFNGSTGSLTGNPQVVNKTDTTTAVTSSQNPSVFGQSVTFTATVAPVAPGTGTPTGTVTFLDGGSPIGTGTLSGGIATFTTSALAVGNHTITTSYGGDGNFNGSTGSLTGNPQVVNKANSTTAVTSSLNPSIFGQSVTFTATVSPTAPGAGTPTGTVTFLDGGSPIGTGTLSGGIATFTTSALAVGNHTITTSYGGDGGFNGSTGSLTGNPQVVSKANSTTAVTSSLNPSIFGQSVTFTATVSPVAPGAGTPTGTVTFLDGGSPIGTGTLSGGIATFTTSVLVVGNHTITTSYGGDGNFNGSTGSLTGNPQVVNTANTTTAVTSSQNPSLLGQSVTFTATVSPVAPGTGTPTGTVTFLDGGSPIGTGTLSGGVATFTTSALALGNHTITTSYGGDGSFNGSTGSLTGNPQVVNKASTTTAVTSSQNSSALGQSITFSATVSPVAPGSGTPTGTVTFLDGGSPIGTGTLSGGIATFTTSALAVGNHTITTSYGGDANFNGSTGSLTGNPQVVVAPPTIVKGFNPVGIQPNGVSTLTVTITNPAANTVAEAGVAFTDNFPANLVVATPNGLTNTCGGTATATAGSGAASLTGGTVPINSSCTVTVNVSSPFTGSYLNSTGPVSSTNGGTGGSASATVIVALPPVISKVFVPDTIFLGAKPVVSFTITNPNSNSTPPNNDVTLTGITFTDALPAGLTVAATPNVSNDCGGTLTAVPGSTSITLTGGVLAPAVGLRPQRRGQIIRSLNGPAPANGSCVISVGVTPANAGTFNNTTGPISANESGPGATSNTATLTVNTPPTSPALAKVFGAPSIPLNATTSLTFTVTNSNASTQLDNLSFSDPLPAGLVVALPNGVTGTCVTDGAVVTANPGSGSISVSALNLPGSSSCLLSLNVTGASAGTKSNVTSNITGVFDDGSGTFVSITGNAASASTVVVAPPSISKAFVPALIGVNSTSALSFTITNPAANTVAQAGVAVTDTLPANLVVATPNGLTGSCGGTVTAVAGSGSIVLTNGSIAVNSSCTFSVNVTSAVTGTYNNISGAVSSTNGGTGNTAAASLIVRPASLSITKTHAGNLSRGQIGATYTITVSNTANTGPTVGTVTVADTLPPRMTATSMSGPGWTCVLATTTCTRSDALAPGASYPPITLVVNLAIDISGNIVNTATVSGGGDPNSHTAMDASHVGPPLNIFLTTPPDNNVTINAGGTAQYVFTVDANGGGLGGINFSAQGLPPGATVTFDKQGETLPETQVTMTITTVGPTAAAMPLRGTGGSPLYAALLLPSFGMGLVLLGRGKKTAQGKKLRLLLLAGFLLMLLLVAGCGGHANNNGGGAVGITPAGSYAVSITATSSAQPNVQATTSVNLTVR